MEKKRCQIEGCERPYSCKGFCKKHYSQKRSADRSEIIAVERKKYRETYRDLIADRKRRWYQKNKADIQQRRKAKYDPESKRLYNQAYFEKNRDAIRAYIRLSQKRFREAKWRAGRRKLEWSISLDEYKFLITNPCAYCGGDLNALGVGLDRVVNSLGYTPENVVPCCRECNRIKGDKLTFSEMKAVAQALNRLRRTRGNDDQNQISFAI